jgi:hypothetical protein
MYGVIILAQEAEPFDPYELVPEVKEAGFPVFVFSLRDIELITHRFNTAADFVHFLELRTDIGLQGKFLINDEAENLVRMSSFAPDIYKVRMQPMTPDVMARTVEAFRRKASGELVESSEWHVGLVIDDMIAHAHDVDPDLAWNQGRPVSTAAEVARFLGWLSRDRRIKLGRRMLSACLKSEAEARPEYFIQH